MSIPAYPVYLFDLDGTLLDSAADICGAIQQVLVQHNRPGVEDAFLRTYIGRHLLDLFEHLLPHYSAAQIDQMIQDYRAIYAARRHTMTRTYPGAAEALAALGGRKSTATTKGTPTTRLVLDMFGLLPYFHHVQGTDGFPAKPAPDVILKALEALAANPEDCLFVGDSGADMEAGRRAGVRTCAVRYGYGDHAEMARHEPDFWIDDLRELVSAGRG
ncbi:MAG: HAD-IA family hydrolase [Acidobacteriia bacterium]|nr:HAD-IA family hydrolase [Terriglobia bacterium]